MNLVKVAELLKNAPDQTLMQEMQHPSGSAPSYMILSELERRKKLRGSLMNNEPQSSVAEDMEREALQANQMGIGSMGMNPMERAGEAPEGYAGGGEVPRFNGQYDDSLVGGPYTSEPGYNPFAWFGEKHGFIKTAPAGWMNDPEYNKWLELGLSPEQAKQKAFGTDTRMGKAPDTEPAIRQAPLAAAPAAAPRSKPPATPAGIPSAGKGTTSDNYSVNPLLEELRGIRKETADAYQKQADAYQKQADEVKNAKASDIGMALMQAGLGIAGGRSQYAMENIGQGAMPAMQAYMGMDRERRKELQKLALGQSQLGIEQLGARMKGVAAEGELGLGGEKLDIMRQEVADKGAYQRGILARANAAAGLKLDPRIAAQAKAIEDQINDEIKLSEGLFGKDKAAAMARINVLRQQKNQLYGLAGAETGAPAAAAPTYNPSTRSW